MDQFFHIFLLGKTGVGKSSLVHNLMLNNCRVRQGRLLVDPHGDLADSIQYSHSTYGTDPLIYLDIANISVELGYNPISNFSTDSHSLIVSGIIETLKKLCDSKSWGVKMEHILRNVLFTLLSQEKADFSCITKILTDNVYKEECISNLSNQIIIDFWRNEFDKYNPYQRSAAIAPILNKIGAFITNPYLYNFLCTDKKQISFRKCMDEGKTVIINLNRGKIGEDASTLLGGLILNSIALAAFSRSDIPEEQRKPCMVYVDEFQAFTTRSLANMLSELRKYKVGMVLANQHLSQLTPEIRDAILGNVGTIISFRLGVADAQYMTKEFNGVFSVDDLLNLPNYHMYLKLMINGAPSKPFSAVSLPANILH